MSFTSSKKSHDSFADGVLHYHDDDLDILQFADPNSLSGSRNSSKTDNYYDHAVDSRSEINVQIENSRKQSKPNNNHHHHHVDTINNNNGQLTDALIEKCLFNLGRTADGDSFTYLDLLLSGKNLIDISTISEYMFIQKLDLSYNSLSDIHSIQYLGYLLDLNLSHNLLDDNMQLIFPETLKILNLSFNRLKTIPDFTGNHYLSDLNLDNNCIESMAGVEVLHRLNRLSLNHNGISQITHIQGLPLVYLSINFNNLDKVENITNLTRLQEIHFSGNKLRTLHGLENHSALHTISLAENQLIDIQDLSYLKGLRILRTLDLRGNPMNNVPDYRLAVIFQLTHLTQLDGIYVQIQEKVRAENLFNPSLEIVAERDHRLNMVYNFFQNHEVLESTLSSPSSPYPMLVLVGPPASGKKALAFKLIEEFPDYFGYALSHTTRPAYPEEENGREYIFVSDEEFEELRMKGRFLQTTTIDNYNYGFSINAMEAIARDGLACIFCTSLEGMMSLKRTPLEPRYVLIMPLDLLTHEHRLRETIITPEMEEKNESRIRHALDQVNIYSKHHVDNPGFFDMFLDSTDIVESYLQLRRLVLGYLGVVDSGGVGSKISDLDAMAVSTSMATTRPPDTGGAISHTTRSWSKNSSHTPTSQKINSSYAARFGKQIESKGRVSEASMQKRQKAARDLISGRDVVSSSQIVDRKLWIASGSGVDGLDSQAQQTQSQSASFAHRFYDVQNNLEQTMEQVAVRSEN